MRLSNRFAFEVLNLEKLTTEVIAANVGSLKAVQKAGFRHYGLARRHFYQNGAWSDLWLGELFREDWELLEGHSRPSEYRLHR